MKNFLIWIKGYILHDCIWIAIILMFAYAFSFDVLAYGYLLVLSGSLLLLHYGYLLYRYVYLYRQLQVVEHQLPQIVHTLETNDPFFQRMFGMLEQLVEEDQSFRQQAYQQQKQLVQFYSIWVHQIKTPIAALSLYIQNLPIEYQDQMKIVLFKIEEYVQMVLQYSKVTVHDHDFLFQKIHLQKLVHQCVKKYALHFILKKLTIHIDVADEIVISDAKWLELIIEQLISNAIKYTPKGGITIHYEQGTLKIQDTGIGIQKEDLPKIMEFGYTGNNGHQQTKSTGIGLYIAKTTATILNLQMHIESQVQQGTTVYLEGFKEYDKIVR